MLKLRTLVAACVLPCCSSAQTAAPDAVNQWIRGGEYHDPDFPVSVKLPDGWTVRPVVLSGGPEKTVALINTQGTSESSLYFKMRPNPAATKEEAYRFLAGRPEVKARERATAPTLADYRIRSDSAERREVGGWPALSCVADFTLHGVKMVEYMTWVNGEKATAFFFARIPAAGLAALRQRLDPVIETLKLP